LKWLVFGYVQPVNGGKGCGPAKYFKPEFRRYTSMGHHDDRRHGDSGEGQVSSGELVITVKSQKGLQSGLGACTNLENELSVTASVNSIYGLSTVFFKITN
jgi:hypothetical protein